jgi:hypothetical protein
VVIDVEKNPKKQQKILSTGDAVSSTSFNGDNNSSILKKD